MCALFGARLHVSGMTDAARVRMCGCPDIATEWTPTLAVVVGVRPLVPRLRRLVRQCMRARHARRHGRGATPAPRWTGVTHGPKHASMDIRQITPTYFVAPQLDPDDMAEIAAAGITTVICNRPDAEVPPAFQADALQAAAEAAGLTFVRLPLTHQTMTPPNVALHMEHVAASSGPVLAYCASGTRSTVVWCLGQAGDMSTDDILQAAQSGGYDLANMRPTIDAIAQSRGAT